MIIDCLPHSRYSVNWEALGFSRLGFGNGETGLESWFFYNTTLGYLLNLTEFVFSYVKWNWINDTYLLCSMGFKSAIIC